MIILLIMVASLIPFFTIFVLYGYFQGHTLQVDMFYSASKRLSTFEEFLTLVRNVNFDKIEKNHLLSRCGDIEIDNNLFRYKEEYLVFGFADFLMVKLFMYFKRNRNILGYVEKTDNVLYIMRALPGVGKSTKAKELVGNGVIHSTDDVMTNIGYGDYKKAFTMTIHDQPAIDVAHQRNFYGAVSSMKRGITPVIIDNMNLRRKAIKRYAKEALKLGYKNENIIIVDLGTGGFTAEELFERNTHGVPLEEIKMFMKMYKDSGPVTIETLFEKNGK